MSTSPSPTPQRFALVTGGGSGIGRAVCRRLAGQGWAVAVADIDAATAEETVAALPCPAGVGHAVELDVADADAWQAAIGGLRARWPRLDLLVNNAGVLVGGDLEALDATDIERAIRVNLLGTAFGCRAATPWLRESVREAPPSERGSPLPGIINTASIFATVSPPGFAAYSATKAGVVALSESLRGELALYGLNVSVTLPGAAPTGLYDRAAYSSPEVAESTRLYLRRAQLDVEQIAAETLLAAARGKPYAVIGRRARLYAWLKRLAPRRLLGVVAGQARRHFTTDCRSNGDSKESENC